MYFLYLQRTSKSVALNLHSRLSPGLYPTSPEQQAYTVRYGLEPNVLDLTWGLLISSQAENQTYSITVQGLTQGTDYYFRVSSTFGYSIIYSDLVSFTTLDPREWPL